MTAPLARPDAVNVAARLAATEAEGPGVRYAIWVQGCPLRCRGCCNPGMLEARDAEWIGADALGDEIAAAPGVEGLSLLGGEPFAQATALARVAARVRAAGRSVVTFTGYTLEELRASPEEGVAALLAATDLLVDGRFEQERASGARPLVGSDNQRLHFLTARYAPLAEGWEAGPDVVEVRLAADGSVRVNGTPPGAGDRG